MIHPSDEATQALFLVKYRERASRIQWSDSRGHVLYPVWFQRRNRCENWAPSNLLNKPTKSTVSARPPATGGKRDLVT